MIYGHEKIRERLQRDLGEGKLSQVLLFCGPSGIGKGLVAEELWRSQYGAEAPEEVVYQMNPQGKKNQFKKGMFLGDDDGDPGLLRWAKQAPPEGLDKWCLIDQAHQLSMNQSGLVLGNLLLNILEEPPKNSRFILISNRPELILKTILSRVVRVDFSPLLPEQTRAIGKTLGMQDPQWFELNKNSIDYPTDGEFQRAVQQVEAWCNVLKGGSFNLYRKVLVPGKGDEESQLEQARKALELLLRVVGDGVRKSYDRPVRLVSFQKILPERIDLKIVDRIYGALRVLGKNPNYEILFRSILEKV